MNVSSQSTDPIGDALVAQLTAPGAPFELQSVVIDGIAQQMYRHAPATLGEIYHSAAANAGRVLCVHDGVHTNYAEIWGKAAALGDFLSAQIRPARGARIAIAMCNRPEWLIAFIAVTALGATAVLINSRGSAAEMAAALRETDTVLLIADEACARLAMRSGVELPLLVAGENTVPGTPWSAFNKAIAGWERAVLRPAALRPDDDALIIFTSGTTGRPKAALLSQRGVVSGVMNIQFSMAMIGAQLAARDTPPAPAAQAVTLLAMPLFHTSGCYSVFLSSLLLGGRIVMLEKWNAAHALQLMAQERVNAVSAAPSMLRDIVRADRSGLDLSALLSIGVGGQTSHPQLLRELQAAFPQAVLGTGYGLTEANGSVCLVAGADLLASPTRSGRIIGPVQVRLVDDHGAEVASGEIGEIWLRGPMLMRGYCKQPEATAQVLRDGWLRTGDLARLDSDGYLHVLDRRKNIVISGGENISCTEVENAVTEHPAVAEAAAFGVPDERLGEKLVVAVVPAPGQTVSFSALKKHAAAQLAVYKLPRDVLFCERLPRNALGKVIRTELRRRYLQQGTCLSA